MYSIYFLGPERYCCEGRIQDGTERWEEPTLEAAVKSMIQFAKVMNGTRITKRSIRYYRPQEVRETQWVEFAPYRRVSGRGLRRGRGS